MAGEAREWVDIDTVWLQGYLQDHNLASGYDLEDELLSAQVSWLLSDDDWTSLRRAWEAERPAESAQASGREAAAKSVPEATYFDPFQGPDDEDEDGDENAYRGGYEANCQDELEDEDASTTAAAIPAALHEDRERGADLEPLPTEAQIGLLALVDRALSDWEAFKELFRDYPDSEEFGIWETRAESPLALLRHAEELIRTRAAEEDEQKREAERVFEEKVSRAQNVIAGYFLYCRKHRLVPSLGHVVTFIPALKTGHEPEAVREAWRRESGFQSGSKGRVG